MAKANKSHKCALKWKKNLCMGLLTLKNTIKISQRFLNLFILENPIQYPLNDKSYTLLNPHNA